MKQRWILNNMFSGLFKNTCRINSCSKQSLTTASVRKDVTEIRIPVPWGHVAGKWWGDTGRQPVLALHGWQDNAGTFDPLLDRSDSPSSSVLAIDFPGHGLSSHFPEAMIYHIQNDVMLLLFIKEHFGWTDKLTILGHSGGAITGFVFAALFPELVGSLVSIDVIKPFASTKRDLDKLGRRMDKLIVKSRRDPGDNPGYSLEELERRWISGTKGSLTAEAVRVLLKRGAKFDPASGLYYLTRDPKLKIISLTHFNENQCLEFAQNIKCNYLVVRFTDSIYFDLSLKNSPTFLDTVSQAAESFNIVTVEGTHHAHLNDPDRVVPVLRDFFKSHNTVLSP